MVFTAVMLGQLLVSYLILKSVVAPAFTQLESSNARENASRVRSAIRAEFERLSSINIDWSSWDSAYEYALGNNPQFVPENMTDDVLDYLRVDWMSFVDDQKQTLLERYGRGQDGRPLSKTSLLAGQPPLHEDLLQHSTSDGTQTVIPTGHGPMLISSFPILRNEGQGYPAGTLILGRLMSEAFVDQVSKLTEVNFSVFPAGEQPQSCPEGQRCDTETVTDINGDPVAILQVHTPSSITSLGASQLDMALKLLALTGLAYLLSVSWLMRRIILVPMSKLAEHIRNVTRTGDLTQRLYLKQRDEIGIVVGNLNAMTNSLERADNQIRRLAYNDALTGLPNRRELDDQLRQILDKQVSEGPEGRGLTLLFIDLDRFKRVNDLLSHEAGDELLVAAARRLRACLRIKERPSDPPAETDKLLARIGGDEFVLAIFEEFDAGAMRGIAKRIIERLEKPFSIKGEMVSISASIGISAFPRDAEDAKTLMRNADTAMYRAKEVGGGTYHIYNDHADAANKERVELARDLRFALERDQLALYYQPQVDLETNRIVGCEALIRWHHPDRGLVLPGDIISMAEEDGSIESIGRWALKEACVNARRWQLSVQEDFNVSVNVSPRQLCRGELIKDVLEALHVSDLHPSCLTIEVTESGVMRNTDLVVNTLASLKQLGITIAMDDFGTGYSSLGYLRQLPIDLIKIDRMFIEELATDPEEAALVAAIIAMAGSLRREVVAEGVETQEQIDLLQSKGCNLVQGFFFGAPCPPTDFELMLRQANPTVPEAQGSADPTFPTTLEPATG